MAIAADRTLAGNAAAPRWRLRSTLPDVAWLTVAQAAAGASAFAASLLRARALTLDAFGAYALVATVVAFLVIIADFGLSVMMVRDLSRAETERRAYLGSAFLLTAVLATIAAMGVVGVSLAIARDASIMPLASMLAISVWLAGLALAPAAFLRATGRTRIEAAARVASGSLLVGLTSMAAVAHGGVVAFGAATAAASGVALVVMLPPAMLAAGIARPQFDFGQWRRLFGDAAPLGFAMMFTAVYYYADSLMLGAFGQREGLARYNASYVFVMAVALLIAALRTGFMPAQSRGHAGQAPLDGVLRGYFRMTAAMALALIVVGPLTAGPVLRICYGAQYEAAAPALRLLLVASGVMCFSSYFGSNLLVAGRQARYLRATIAGAALNVAANLAVIPMFGLTGAATVTLFSELLVCALVARAGRDFPTPRLLPALAPTAIASIVVAAVALLVVRAGAL